LKGKLQLRNLGNRRADRIDISFFFSDDGVALNKRLKTITFPTLGAGQTENLTFKLGGCTPQLLGKFIIAFIDSRQRVRETNEANNRVVSATPSPNKPLADPGPDQTVRVGDTVHLDAGKSSDADGDRLTYKWSFVSVPAGSHAVLSDPAAVEPTFPIDLPGNYVVQLVVKDGYWDSSPKTVRIATTNSPPVAEAGPDQTVSISELVCLDGSHSCDVDGDLLTYHWSLLSTPAGSGAVLSAPTHIRPCFVADLPETYVVQLIVNDGSFDSRPDTVTVSTHNSPPVANAGPEQTVAVTHTVTLDGSGSEDVDGDLLSFKWSFASQPAGSKAKLSDPAALKPTFTVDAPGTYVVQLMVNDGKGASKPDTVTITTRNSRPVADAGPDQTALVNDTIHLDGTGSSDVDGDLLAFRWSFLSRPDGCTAILSEPNAVKPTFEIDLPGAYVAQLIVNDGMVDSKPSTVTILTENSKPLAEAGPDQTVTVGAAVVLDGSGSLDVDGDPLTYRWALTARHAHSSAVLMDATSATPSLIIDRDGTYVAQLIVHDGKEDSKPDMVTISTLNSKPVADAGAYQTVFVGEPVALDGSGSTDADLDVMTYRWSFSSILAGSSADLLDISAAKPAFIPDVAGAYVVQLIVNDGQEDSNPDTTCVMADPLPMMVVPDVVGMGHSAAAEAIAAAGLSLGQITEQYSDTIPQGQVISQNPAPGALAFFGSVVDFTVSLGRQMISVPDVLGLSQANAEASINAAALTVGTVTSAHSETVSAGLVISQNPVAGTSVLQGSVVDLVISLGPSQNELPPDPANVAPPLPATNATALSEATSFLYTGTNPIQTGVAAGIIEFKRTAVLRGGVLGAANQPLPGVTVTVLNHSELGQTLTRTDGKYDPAVNGGGVLTLNFEKTGYLRGQRTLPNVPWQDYLPVDDVVMVEQDSKVTTIDLATASEPMQPARGSVVNDAAGERQATLLIPQGITAEVHNADGSTRSVNQLTLRLTEYTVGEDGPKKMPAPLPPTSAYTYAVELSVEEAQVKIAGRDVLFNAPVPFYVENFLNMPIGIQVPVGYYDRDKAAWIPSDDGRVIKILSVNGGLALLDTDGDGIDDNGSVIGVTDGERQKLAQLYCAGQSLWRVPLSHLSTYDHNYGVVPAAGSVPPSPPKARTGDGPKPDDPCRAGGSDIECQNQILGEVIGITGTPFSLHYASDRVPGHKGGNTLDITLSGSTVPSVLKRIELEINVAGRAFKQTFPAAPDQHHIFEWDGKDGYGRELGGKQPATIRIGYVYDSFYALPPSITRSFGVTSGQRIPGDILERQETILWQTQDQSLGSGMDQDQYLGGWTLNLHLSYDPTGKILYLGDGNRASAANINGLILNPFAGNWGSGYSGDGGPATAAELNIPLDVAVGPDGSFYIADTRNQRIRRVGPDGIITTFAGNGQSGYSGDGGPATAAQLSLFFHCRVAVGPDGSVYISTAGGDDQYSRILRAQSALPGFSADEITIPSSDGNLLYAFDGSGRHLRTHNALTNAVLYQFGYDAEGRLTSVTDAGGNVTTIERNASGNAMAIVAPLGQRTELTLDANGYLATVTNPAGETHTMSYTPDGDNHGQKDSLFD
jgi:YD repeat-containing protein